MVFFLRVAIKFLGICFVFGYLDPYGMRAEKVSPKSARTYYLGYWRPHGDPREDPTSRTPNSGLQYSNRVDYITLRWIYW